MRHRLLKTIKLTCSLVIYVLVFPISSMADDYQDGLQAYLDGDFVLARQSWLAAANAKDAKSMFNLGLLHEQNKLDNASLDKALNWYRLAADNGYAAAGYHLAQRMLERGGSDDDAIALIRRAADSGYSPARRYLGLSSPQKSTSEGNAVSTTSTDSSTLKVSPRSVEGSNKGRNWINRQRAEHWTIQLLAFKSEQQVLRFIEEHRLNNKAAYFSEAKRGEVFYKLVYGSYDNKDKATFARQNLSDALQEHGPWLRTWASVHKITNP